VSARIGNLGAPLERRLRVRQRLDDLIYLDIGADNGGIVLNLSEEGLRFQAVGPLEKQSELRLRIKIPGSQARIDVIAQIAWLSDSKRQAGVRFLDVPSKGLAQIHEWIRSQLPPPSPLEESSKQVEELSESQRKQETIQEIPTDKRHDLISEFGLSELSWQEPAENGSGKTFHSVPAARKDPVSYQKPELVAPPIAEPAESSSVARPAMHEESLPLAAVPVAQEAAVIPEKSKFVAPPIAKPAEMPSVARPATREEALLAAAVPVAQEVAVIPEKSNFVAPPIVEPAEMPSAVRPALREELLLAAAVPVAQEAAIIPEKSNFVAPPIVESAPSPSVIRPASQEKSIQAAAVPAEREAAVIPEKLELASEPIAEPAVSTSMGRQAIQEEFAPTAAVPTKQQEPAVISEKPEFVPEPIAEPARLPSVEHPAPQTESLQSVAFPVGRREDAVIWENTELVSEPVAEPARLPSIEHPVHQEESLPVVAVPVTRKGAVISEKPELVSEPIAEIAESLPVAAAPTEREAAVISGKPEFVPEPIAEIAESLSVGGAALQEESLPVADVPSEREDAVFSGKPELVSEPFAGPANSIPEGPQATQEELPHVEAVPTPGALARMEPDAGDAPITTTSKEESRRKSALGWPVSVYRATAMEMPRPPDAPRKPVERFVTAGNSQASSAPPVVNPVVASPAATDRMLLWNQVAIAILLTLCAILCFGIGTWVGQIVTRRNSPTAQVAPVNFVATADPAIKASAVNPGGNAGRPAPATAEKVRSAPAPVRPALESRKVAPTVSSPDVAPLPQNTPSIPPAEQNVAAVPTAKVQESIPPVVPAQVDPPAPAPSPRIVAGLTLKPSDRFNPSHLTYRVQPAYPPEAQKQQIEGVVKIHQVIGTDGRVRTASLLSGPPLLVTAALEAARYWRYLPALLNGQPVETEQDVEIEFRLPY
jgi:periplasmic protein TonB